MVINWREQGFGKFSLHYIRNRDKEEVDFLISNENDPILLIECRQSDKTVSKNLIKFQNMLNIPAVQLVNIPGICRKKVIIKIRY